MTPGTLGDELRALYEAEAPRPPANQPVPRAVNRSYFWQGCVAFWLFLNFLWEIAWNPGFPLREDGSIDLP
jgi:hypothetical protein